MPLSGKSSANPFVKAVTKSQTTQAAAGMSQPEGGTKGQSSLKGVSLVASRNVQSMSLRRAGFWSVVVHVVAPVAIPLLCLLVMLLLSWIFHWNLWDWFRPKPAPADIEFVLVKDTQAKRPEKPLFKGVFNQQAGGEKTKQPPRPIEEAVPPAVTSQQPETKPEPKPVVKPAETVAKPLPKPVIATPGKTVAPIPITNNVTASASSNNASEGLLNSLGNMMAGMGAGTTSLGSAQGGDNPNAGVDVAEDVDFGPFMDDMQRRIKRNWVPPRGAESQRVLLLFYLQRNGQLVKVEVKKTSGDEVADQAAMAAIRASSPFMPFPPQVKEDILPVEFTFDYNVLNPHGGKRK